MTYFLGEGFLEDCSYGILLIKDFTILIPFKLFACRRCVFFLLAVGVDNKLVKEFPLGHNLADYEGGSITGESMLLTGDSTYVAVSWFGVISVYCWFLNYSNGISREASSGFIVVSKEKIPIAWKRKDMFDRVIERFQTFLMIFWNLFLSGWWVK